MEFSSACVAKKPLRLRPTVVSDDVRPLARLYSLAGRLQRPPPPSTTPKSRIAIGSDFN